MLVFITKGLVVHSEMSLYPYVYNFYLAGKAMYEALGIVPISYHAYTALCAHHEHRRHFAVPLHWRQQRERREPAKLAISHCDTHLSLSDGGVSLHSKTHPLFM